MPLSPSDIPPTTFVRSALQALSKADIEATVIYTVDKNGKRTTRADSNNGPVGMARQLASVRISDGAIERSAVALHEFRLQLPDDVTDVVKAEMDKCPLCGEAANWSMLDDGDREGHRTIVKLILGNALAAPPAAAPLVSV